MVLFADGRRNPDRVNHLRTNPLLNGMVLRWEDGFRGGDRDFSDGMLAPRRWAGRLNELRGCGRACT